MQSADGYERIGPRSLYTRPLLHMPGAEVVRNLLHRGDLPPDGSDRSNFELLWQAATQNRKAEGLIDAHIALWVHDGCGEVVCAAIISRIQCASLLHWVYTVEDQRERGHCTEIIRHLREIGEVAIETSPSKANFWLTKGMKHRLDPKKCIAPFFQNTCLISTHEQSVLHRRTNPTKASAAAAAAAVKVGNLRASVLSSERVTSRLPGKKRPVSQPEDACRVDIACFGESFQINRLGTQTVAWQDQYLSETDEHRRVEKEAEDLLRQFAAASNNSGLVSFRGLQLPVIVAAATAATNQNVVAHMPTGSGKTLIYQILGELTGGGQITLVFEPLKALKREQYERAVSFGIDCMELNGLDKRATARQVDELQQGNRPALLFLTPEMAAQNLDVKRCLTALAKSRGLARAVIDEAHYVAACDDNFRPFYRELGAILKQLDVPLLMLTATMTPHILSILWQEFSLSRTDLFFRGAVDESLGCHAISVHSKRFGGDFVGIIQTVKRDLATAEGVGIVFCLRKDDTEKLAAALQAKHIQADYFHSTRSAGDKERIMRQWHSGRLRVVVATEAFGLGIDHRGDVLFVHHLQPPINMACLQQHLGRARNRSGQCHVSCGIWWHQQDYEAARRVLGYQRLPVVPATDEEMRRAADLGEVYQFLFDVRSCRRRTVVRGSCPGNPEIPSCGTCDTCGDEMRFTESVDASTDLREAINIVFRDCSEGLAEPNLRKELRRAAKLSEEVASKLIFAALRLKILREEKFPGSVRSKKIVKGPEFHRLGQVGGIRIHYKMDAPSTLSETQPESSDEEDETCDETLDETCELQTDNSEGEEDQDQATCIRAVWAPPRLIRHFVDDWQQLPRWLIECLLSAGRATWQDVDPQLAEDQMRSGSDVSPLQRRFGKTAWQHLPPSSPRYRWTFAASVKLDESELPKFTLDWPRFVNRFGSAAGRTKRIYEYYGASNVLIVTCEQGGQKGAYLYRQLRSANSLIAAGRAWHKPKARPDKNGHQLIFFAVRAEGDSPRQRAMYQRRLIQLNDGPIDHWHFHPSVNGTKTLVKALARVSLMMSDVVPTVTLRQDQIVRVPPDDLETRTDGACDIAPDLISEVWIAFCQRTCRRSDGVTPSTFQGRLMGMKGTWSVNHALKGIICYRDHQQKFKVVGPTPEQLTIEVCEWAEDSGPARINQQNIRQMEARVPAGCLAELLTELLQQELARESCALTELASAEELCVSSGADGKAILDMLDSGMHLDSERVQSALKRLLKSSAHQAFSSGKLPQSFRLEASRHMMIIPDKFQLLAEDEILLKVPRMERFTDVAVLARNPGYLPEELLKVRGVDPFTLSSRASTPEIRAEALTWYCALQCVCVLSVKGPNEKGVADKMQGGDYDGDKVIVIWDKRVTDEFQDVQAYRYSDGLSDALLTGKLEDCGPGELDDKLWAAMEHLVELQGGEPKIALLSRLHQSWADRAADDWSGLAGANARRCGDLAHKAVDMSTSGYVVEVPDDLQDVQPPRYCFTEDKLQPTVFVGGLPSSTTDAVLRSAFERQYPSTRTAYVVKNRGGATLWGFVSFNAEADMHRALNKGSIAVLGATATINDDTRVTTQLKQAEAARPPSHSAVGRLWEVIQGWLDSPALAGVDAPLKVARDEELEAQWLCDNHQINATAMEDYTRAKILMMECQNQGQDGYAEVIAQLRSERDSRTGLERDQYAAKMWSIVRQDLKERLASWEVARRDSSQVVQRPELRWWMEEVFGPEWNRIKKMTMPSTRASARPVYPTTKRGSKRRHG